MPERPHETGSTPVPDPTLLTTAALTREIAALKELVTTRLDAMDKAQSLFETNLTRVPTEVDKQIGHLKELHDTRLADNDHQSELRRQVMEARLNGMDKAILLVQDISDKFITRVQERIDSLRVVHEERFASIQVQFKERDVRTDQSSKDSKVAVDAALQAAKEAVGAQNNSSALAIAKSETATMKQIDQLNTLFQGGFKSVDDKFDDIKERITRIEGKDQGAATEHTGTQVNNTYVIAIIGLVLTFVSVGSAIYVATRTAAIAPVMYGAPK